MSKFLYVHYSLYYMYITLYLALHAFSPLYDSQGASTVARIDIMCALAM